MSSLKVTLIASSQASHLQQIYTGFAALARAGLIHLRLNRPDGAKEPDPGPFKCIAVVNGGRRIAYDLKDNHLADLALLNRVDAYYKRSYSCPRQGLSSAEAGKIHPLGLNYEVYPDHVDVRGAVHQWCCRSGMKRARGLLRPLKLMPKFVPRQTTFEPSPGDRTDPFVVFITRVWDPENFHPHANSDAHDRHSVNEMRAACISALRQHFGQRTIAGLIQSDYAARHYPHLQIANAKLTMKASFQKILRRAAVCVTTTGLHRSIGWKMGEYVALGKAIVSEPMSCDLPGDFRADQNYLAFDSPDQCVAQADRLLTATDQMTEMMQANRAYYQDCLRPDRLILNTLKDGGVDVRQSRGSA